MQQLWLSQDEIGGAGTACNFMDNRLVGISASPKNSICLHEIPSFAWLWGLIRKGTEYLQWFETKNEWMTHWLTERGLFDCWPQQMYPISLFKSPTWTNLLFPNKLSVQLQRFCQDPWNKMLGNRLNLPKSQPCNETRPVLVWLKSWLDNYRGEQISTFNPESTSFPRRSIFELFRLNFKWL